ncbi:hypothetical protein DICVIV_01668 [Dictyocaulus viviparus]|uniref:Uncharacterized protein n=1 Tax=Dictyocaulus viviparus TaxID=29172 RepID=A0A0D8Y5U3_DICVI|nr:hypothetical protein DICVIV_01668 [Dictyocaulus viviparus]
MSDMFINILLVRSSMSFPIRNQVLWNSATLVCFVIATSLTSIVNCTKKKPRRCDNSEMPKNEYCSNSKKSTNVSKEEKSAIPSSEKKDSMERLSFRKKGSSCKNVEEIACKNIRKPPPISERPKFPGKMIEQDNLDLSLQTLNLVKNEDATFE